MPFDEQYNVLINIKTAYEKGDIIAANREMDKLKANAKEFNKKVYSSADDTQIKKIALEYRKLEQIRERALTGGGKWKSLSNDKFLKSQEQQIKKSREIYEHEMKLDKKRLKSSPYAHSSAVTKAFRGAPSSESALALFNESNKQLEAWKGRRQADIIKHGPGVGLSRGQSMQYGILKTNLNEAKAFLDNLDTAFKKSPTSFDRVMNPPSGASVSAFDKNLLDLHHKSMTDEGRYAPLDSFDIESQDINKYSRGSSKNWTMGFGINENLPFDKESMDSAIHRLLVKREIAANDSLIQRAQEKRGIFDTVDTVSPGTTPYQDMLYFPQKALPPGTSKFKGPRFPSPSGGVIPAGPVGGMQTSGITSTGMGPGNAFDNIAKVFGKALSSKGSDGILKAFENIKLPEKIFDDSANQLKNILSAPSAGKSPLLALALAQLAGGSTGAVSTKPNKLVLPSTSTEMQGLFDEPSEDLSMFKIRSSTPEAYRRGVKRDKEQRFGTNIAQLRTMFTDRSLKSIASDLQIGMYADDNQDTIDSILSAGEKYLNLYDDYITEGRERDADTALQSAAALRESLRDALWGNNVRVGSRENGGKNTPFDEARFTADIEESLKGFQMKDKRWQVSKGRALGFDPSFDFTDPVIRSMYRRKPTEYDRLKELEKGMLADRDGRRSGGYEDITNTGTFFSEDRARGWLGQQKKLKGFKSSQLEPKTVTEMDELGNTFTRTQYIAKSFFNVTSGGSKQLYGDLEDLNTKFYQLGHVVKTSLSGKETKKSLGGFNEMFKKSEALSGRLKKFSWTFTMMSMASLGMFFSMMSLVNLLKMGLGAIVTPMTDLQGMFQGAAMGIAASSIIGVDPTQSMALDDPSRAVAGWALFTKVMSDLQTALVNLGLSLFVSETGELTDLGQQLLDVFTMVCEYLQSPQVQESIKSMLSSLLDALPGIVALIPFVAKLFEVLGPYLPVLLGLAAIAAVLMPVLSAMSFLVMAFGTAVLGPVIVIAVLILAIAAVITYFNAWDDVINVIISSIQFFIDILKVLLTPLDMISSAIGSIFGQDWSINDRLTGVQQGLEAAKWADSKTGETPWVRSDYTTEETQRARDVNLQIFENINMIQNSDGTSQFKTNTSLSGV